MHVVGDEETLVGRVVGAEGRAEQLAEGDALRAGGPVDEDGVDERAGDGWRIDAQSRKMSGHVLEGPGPGEGADQRGYAFAHCGRLQAREIGDVLADFAEACQLSVALNDEVELIQRCYWPRTCRVQHQIRRIVQGCGEEPHGRGHARYGVCPPPSMARATSR